MCTLGKDGIDTFFLTNNPNTILLFILFAHLADGVIRRKAGLER